MNLIEVEDGGGRGAAFLAAVIDNRRKNLFLEMKNNKALDGNNEV